ncbi:MAG: allantoate deiminase [Lysinibacillus fusiformis]|uniref:allantoate deiminase n=1 Tax=Lysinibacillus fusiformis TaxID=28031 RepID=UPI001E5B0437|nr:allantoate deiminase [Lysinibacillus fusiformis]MDC6266805.1 allantoate deiminase [Lysinibacillus sphaericus]MCE4042508.1 allantoate deiminase [Lysinibacillus fusiformis]MCT6929080.1 allantoate deiminase [Lysinibacillus fusiformis]MCT6932016.1 allantoate deiminase [Lysinibacillus fusiformis]MDN4968935.1 allantoate deiminase [Lysinibacillus fusiformis]
MDIQSTFESLDKKFTGFGGLEQGGITRLLYSQEWNDAVRELEKTFKEEGLEASFDDIGNLTGRLVGSKYPEETILTGSHIDTVVEGGHLDGQFGILAALVAVKYLKAKHGQPLRSLEVLSLAEEEGSRFPYTFWGSKNFFNLAKKSDVETIADAEGIKFEDAMRKSGFDYRKTNDVRNDIKAFVEIHIEQGKVLETENKTIGVVNGIVGQKRFTINLKGEANHAGTTPMSLRRDTVVAYSEIVSDLTKRAREIGEPLVLTFGHITLVPNTVNVVPGEITFSVDCRHIDQQILNDFAAEIEDKIRLVAEANSMTYDIHLWMDEAPTLMDKKIVQIIEQAAKNNVGNQYKVMPSGAGHDSQIFAQYVPTAMLFVPSIGGISHNISEETKIEDLVKGIEVLSDVLYELAYKE